VVTPETAFVDFLAVSHFSTQDSFFLLEVFPSVVVAVVFVAVNTLGFVSLKHLSTYDVVSLISQTHRAARIASVCRMV